MFLNHKRLIVIKVKIMLFKRSRKLEVSTFNFTIKNDEEIKSIKISFGS